MHAQRIHLHACYMLYSGKGPTALALLPSFNLVKGIAVDYMHCILLGVCRLLLRLWLNTEHHQSLWYIGGKLKKWMNYYVKSSRLMK